MSNPDLGKRDDVEKNMFSSESGSLENQERRGQLRIALKEAIDNEQEKRGFQAKKETVFPTKADIEIEKIKDKPKSFVYFTADHIRVTKLKRKISIIGLEKTLKKKLTSFTFNYEHKIKREKLFQLAKFLSLNYRCKDFVDSKTHQDAKRAANILRDKYKQKEIADFAEISPDDALSDLRPNIIIKTPFAGMIPLSDLLRRYHSKKEKEMLVNHIKEIIKNNKLNGKPEVIPDAKEVMDELCKQDFLENVGSERTIREAIYEAETEVKSIVIKLLKKYKWRNIPGTTLEDALKENHIGIMMKSKFNRQKELKRYITSKQKDSLLRHVKEAHQKK